RLRLGRRLRLASGLGRVGRARLGRRLGQGEPLHDHEVRAGRPPQDRRDRESGPEPRHGRPSTTSRPRLTGTVPSYYRPRAVLRRCFSMCVVLTLASASASARAQVDEERPGEARGGSYAWGAPAAAQPEDPLRIMAYLGGGVGFRLLANLDPPFNHEFLSPAYLELGGAVFLPGAELRHGVGF